MNSLLASLRSSAIERARELPKASTAPGGTRPSFADALRGKDRVSCIAEFKRCSPSDPQLALDRDLVAQIRSYETGGAAALSILTESTRFGGSFEDLRVACQTSSLPVLMKDFVVDARQLHAAHALGASAVLLIVRILARDELRELADLSADLQLDVLVECHDEREIEDALRIDDALIGVNNRDLDTLDVDITRALRLLPQLPEDRIAVAESGYRTRVELDALRGRADAALIGSAFMTSDDPSAFLTATPTTGSLR